MIHLDKASTCLQTIQACFPPMPLDEVNHIDGQDREVEIELRKQGWWAAKAFDPAFPVAGPFLPPPEHPAAREMHAKLYSPPSSLGRTDAL